MRRLIETFIKHKLSIFKRPEIDPFQASDSEIENVYDYEPYQLLDSDEDVEILFYREKIIRLKPLVFV